ncbi:oxidoreductase NAD-binding domain-containing protein [Ditylenchus destructor]|nr:oxidoreductase NAD-binding domain-containing protein [Ditylenchus destructor]
MPATSTGWGAGRRAASHHPEARRAGRATGALPHRRPMPAARDPRGARRRGRHRRHPQRLGRGVGALAKLLIDAEEQVYAATAAQPGGWRGQRAVRVARKEDESELITSFYLESVEGPGPGAGGLPARAIPDPGAGHRRSDGAPQTIRCRRAGQALVPRRRHDPDPGAGRRVHARRPSQASAVLVTGGVGITPAMGGCWSPPPASGRPIRFIHAARHGGVHAFRARVDALAAAHANVDAFYVYDTPRDGDAPHAVGLIGEGLLASQLPADRDVDLYLLGPKPFMRAVYRSGRALGIPEQQLRYEFLRTAEELVGGDPRALDWSALPNARAVTP